MLSEYVTCPFSLAGILQSPTGNNVQLCHQDGCHLGLSIPRVLPSHPVLGARGRTQRGTSGSVLRRILLQLVLPPVCIHPGVLCAPAPGDLL